MLETLGFQREAIFSSVKVRHIKPYDSCSAECGTLPVDKVLTTQILLSYNCTVKSDD